MRLSATDLGQLSDLARSAAVEAGLMIAASRPEEIGHKSGTESLASQVVTEIDRRSEAIILDKLEPTLERFELGLLTEEQPDDRGRLDADHFWCIDPLDGTLPFIEGSPGYAVSVALVAQDGTPRIGVVYDPVESTALHAISGVGAFCDGRPWVAERPAGGAVLSVFTDRSFLRRDDQDALAGALHRMADDLGLAGLRYRTDAGAVMNACGVLTNPPACYFKLPKPTGGGSLWDFAATACLFHEAGAVATDITGDALDLNRADSTSMSHRGVLFATDDVIAGQVRSLAAVALERGQ